MKFFIMRYLYCTVLTIFFVGGILGFTSVITLGFLTFFSTHDFSFSLTFFLIIFIEITECS